MWVPRIKNWTMKQERHTTQDQHESTRRSSWTRSAFPSIRSLSQLCSWLAHTGNTANSIVRNFRTFSVCSVRFLTKPPSILPPRSSDRTAPVNNRCFRILIENFLAAMQVGRVWGPGHDRFCKFLSSEKFVFRMYNLYKMLFIVNFLTRLKLSIHTNFNVQEAKIVEQEIFHPRLCTVSEQFFFCFVFLC